MLAGLLVAPGVPLRAFQASATGSASVDQTPPPVEYVCPMDPDIRSLTPGRCPRCGMALVPGIAEPVECPLNIQLKPALPRPGRPVQLIITVYDPKTGKQITDFQIVHEKLFHLFVVSQDLQFFLHEHPEKGPDGAFRYDAIFPKPGLYRILSDFYPQMSTPQLIAKTIILPGGTLGRTAELKPDLVPKPAGNMEVSLTTEPPRPIAGMKTLMFFHLNPADDLQLYLGAWGHMLAASDDLIDLIHNHPFIADGGPQVQFNLIFPRPRTYRVWVQFQRKGVVNTAVFNVPVGELK
jgi:hypothetical protein